MRECIKDCYLSGIAIKKGTLVNTASLSNHFSQKYFKQPYEFRPERWLNGECEGQGPYVVLGFSGGARTCLGKHLALMESKIILIKFMKRYKKIELSDPNFRMKLNLLPTPENLTVKLTLK